MFSRRTVSRFSFGSPRNVSIANAIYRFFSVIAALVGLLSVLQLRAEEKPPDRPAAERIESPKGTFFFEQRYDRANGVWIVSAKDPAVYEPLSGFDNVKDCAITTAVISPDENWIFFLQHFGSHANSTYLYRRKEDLKFEPVFKADFDDKAWKFFCGVEGVSRKKVDSYELEVHEWSPDSGRLLFQLYGNLSGTPDGNGDQPKNHEKPGVSGWWAYYNTKTGKFELTDKLRAANKGVRKRWTFYESKESQFFLAPEAESIGHEGPDRPAAERLKEYQQALSALIERRKTQLDSEAGAEFEKDDSDWRNRTDKRLTEFKDSKDRMAARAAATFDHLLDLQEAQWLPVY
jgi:hypothetical protein